MNKSSFFILGQHAVIEALRNPKRKVILVTRDINMRVKCDSLGIPTEDYVPNRVVEDESKLYSGFKIRTCNISD